MSAVQFRPCLFIGRYFINNYNKGKAADAVRVNEGIRAPQIRVIGADGEQLGLMDRESALDLAYNKGLDLVEVHYDSGVSTCKILDYGKYKYQKEKKQKEAKKKQTVIAIKQIRMRPKIETHDYETKLKHVRNFLNDGNKVKIVLMFRGREMSYQEKGEELLKKMIQDTSDISVAGGLPKMEGRFMNVELTPLRRK